MQHEFKYKTVPFDHQRSSFESTREAPHFAYFWEMGTGKSKMMIDTAQWLFTRGLIDSVIITAEKGYYYNWVGNEFPTHWNDEIPIRVRAYRGMSGTVAQRRFCDEILVPQEGTLDVLVINIEAFSTQASGKTGGGYFTNLFLDRHKSTLFIVDESTTIKSPQAARTKNVTKLASKAKYRRILTGTPITQSPLDLFAQCEFLQKGSLGFRSFSSFRAEYAIMRPMQFGYTARPVMQITGYRGLDQLARSIQPFSSRLLKKDCLTLPEKMYAPIYVEKTDEQAKHIHKLQVEAVSMINSQEVTVENALSILTKSLQIASGHLKDDRGMTHRLECNKAAVLKNLVNDLRDDQKVIVWGYFHEDMEIIQECLSGICPVFEVSGRVIQSEREYAIEKFRKHEGKCVFLASPRVAGKSLTLVEADVSVYYSNGFNLEHRLQSEDRNHRIGQNKTVTYYDLICESTPDVKVVQALKDKVSLAESVLTNLRSLLID